MPTTPISPPTEQDGFAVENLRFAQGGRTILQDLGLCVAPGTCVCLLGPSGSGKTSLLRLLAGLERPNFGRVTYNGLPVIGQGLERGVVFEDCGFIPWLSIEDNMAMAIDAARPGTPSLTCQELAREFLNLMGLAGMEAKRPLELSRGMRQRAAMARALAMGSPVLLLDDPFCVLDPAERALSQDLLARLLVGPARRTVILATNDLDEALVLADRILGLCATPGPLVVDLALDAPRPRDRQNLAEGGPFTAPRRRITELYHQDARRRLAAEEIFGLGAGI